MRWSKDQMMIDDDGGVMFNIACRLGTGTLWDAPRVFYCETPVSSVSRVMCNPELFICTNLVFDNTLFAFAHCARSNAKSPRTRHPARRTPRTLSRHGMRPETLRNSEPEIFFRSLLQAVGHFTTSLKL